MGRIITSMIPHHQLNHIIHIILQIFAKLRLQHLYRLISNGKFKESIHIMHTHALDVGLDVTELVMFRHRD